jgi:hypothetical protein
LEYFKGHFYQILEIYLDEFGGLKKKIQKKTEKEKNKKMMT